MKVAVTIEESKFNKFIDKKLVPADCSFVFAKSPAPEDMGDALDAEVLYVNSMTPVKKETMDSMPNLKMIHTEGVAFNQVDVEYARSKGIYVCNARAANAPQVAEQAILLMLNVLHRFEEGSQAMKAGLQKETQFRFIQEGLLDLYGKRVGIVGFGAIGKEIAIRLKTFGCTLCYYDPFPASPELEKQYCIERFSLEELLASSDIVSLHLPVTPETTGMFNKELIAKMKSNAILVNTSRGEIVNNEDLADAIRKGVIYGAALDTIAPEPVPKDSPLLALEAPYCYRVALSPHIAGTTLSAFRRMYEIFTENITLVQKGEVPNTLVYRL